MDQLRRAEDPAADDQRPRNLSSGVPYGAVGTVDARPYVSAAVLASYVTPQGGTSETYYYTARDAFHTGFRVPHGHVGEFEPQPECGRLAKLDLFVQMHVLNIFNQFQLCGCGDSVFNNGGQILLTRINTGVNSPNRDDASELQPLHADAGAGRELGPRSRVRHGPKPHGVHVAA